MKLEVLMSCMYQADMNIWERSKVHCGALIVNQCEKNDYRESNINNWHIRMVSTTERGLSKSRNMAIKNAVGDICLICDDDEEFIENYVEKIINEFNQRPEYDIITFSLVYPPKKFPKSEHKVGFIRALRTNSVQIAFRRNSILNAGVWFDSEMGSGTGNGGGEEIKFLFDCLKKGLKIYFVPIVIATVKSSSSQWFQGYTKTYFINRGYSTRKILGWFLGCGYILYFSLKKYSLYKHQNSVFHAIYYQIKGMFKSRGKIN